MQNIFLISYNGSRFDNYLLFNSILENDIRIKNLLQKESDLLNFSFNGNKLVDISRYLNLLFFFFCEL